MSDEKHHSEQDSRFEFALRVGTVEIQLRGDPLEWIIQAADLDAIVSSDDSTLSMSGGVSAAIARMAGTSIRNEVSSRLPLPVGAVAVTSGGRLPVRYILHAVTVDWASGVLPTERTIRQLLRDILSRCEALRITRIAIPALATGAAGLSPLVSAKIIVEGLRAHLLNPTVLQSIVMPIPNLDVRQAFAGELEASPLEDVTARRLRFKRMRPIEGVDSTGESEAERSVPVGTPRRGWLSSLLRSPKGDARRAPGSTTLPAGPTGAASDIPIALAGSASSRPLLKGRFVLLEEIGRGGMAVVYLSWDLILRRTVAIKILRPELTESDSLAREASVALDLTHRGIVRIHHFEPGHPGTGAFLVMEYVPWPSGEKWIADAGAGRLPVHPIVSIAVRICDALAYAHGRGVLHLDIKPSNIFVDPGGEDAKLGDFGLARVSSAGGTVLQLRLAGTPAYMAPEQRVRGASVGPATDVYQLGATLWDFLMGAPPSARTTGAEPDPDRTRLLSALAAALAADPAHRPSVSRLREMVAAAA